MSSEIRLGALLDFYYQLSEHHKKVEGEIGVRLKIF